MSNVADVHDFRKTSSIECTHVHDLEYDTRKKHILVRMQLNHLSAVSTAKKSFWSFSVGWHWIMFSGDISAFCAPVQLHHIDNRKSMIGHVFNIIIVIWHASIIDITIQQSCHDCRWQQRMNLEYTYGILGCQRFLFKNSLDMHIGNNHLMAFVISFFWSFWLWYMYEISSQQQILEDMDC